MTKLSNPVALVTGSAVGIGRATALALARNGVDVAVHHHSNGASAGAAASEIRACGRQATALQGDLTKAGDVTRVVESVLACLAGSTSWSTTRAGSWIATRSSTSPRSSIAQSSTSTC